MKYRGCRGRDRIVAGFTTDCAISAYHHYHCEFESCSWWGVLDTTICDDSDLWQVGGFLRVVFSTNKIDRNDITEILLKVVLNNITVTTVWSTGAKHVENYKIY
jgi:hypothetical protein